MGRIYSFNCEDHTRSLNAGTNCNNCSLNISGMRCGYNKGCNNYDTTTKGVFIKVSELNVVKHEE
jgi:hypothetical protein